MPHLRSFMPAASGSIIAPTALLRRTHGLSAAVLGVFVLTTAAAEAATYRVGVGQPYATLAALPTLQPGDVVEIMSGTYREVRRWTASGTPDRPITIRGVGARRPVFDATGLSVNGSLPNPRAIFQIEGSDYVIENLEFRNARNGNNGAGLRVTGSKAVRTTIRNVYVHQNDVGMMADGNDLLLVEFSEFAFNGPTSGAYNHNIYIDTTNRVTFRFCYIHDATAGINFKSRAHYTELLYNHIADGADAEVSLVNSAATATAFSNALLLGNVIVSKPRCGSCNQVKYLDFGQDNGGAHLGTLYLVNNTLVAGSGHIEFLWATAPEARIEATNNVFFGSNKIVGRGSTQVSGVANSVGSNATVPAGFTATVRATAPGFVDASARDYRLTSSSPLIDRGFQPVSVDGEGQVLDATPLWHYLHPLSGTVRKPTGGGALDLGAYELGVETESAPIATDPSSTPLLPPDDVVAPSVTISVSQAGKWTTISATATDNVAVLDVVFAVDGHVVGTATKSPYSVRVRMASGAHSITATARDAAGNATTATWTGTLR